MNKSFFFLDREIKYLSLNNKRGKQKKMSFVPARFEINVKLEIQKVALSILYSGCVWDAKNLHFKANNSHILLRFPSHCADIVFVLWVLCVACGLFAHDSGIRLK